MGLTTTPFHPVTNELLPGYRDAYLRGDLSRTNMELVNVYLQKNTVHGDTAFQRFNTLKAAGHAVRPMGWVEQQLQLLRTEPARFRRRASSLLMAAVLVSGMVMAGTRSGDVSGPFGNPGTLHLSKLSPAAGAELSAAVAAAATTTLRGQILNEDGKPLVGATVLDKASGRGVSTDAQGNYALQVPANRATRLQYGFGGYHEEDVQVRGMGVQNVTLLPDVAKLRRLQKRHWWQF